MGDKIDKNYLEFLGQLKTRISKSRYQVARTVNQELILLYWDIGNSILDKQKVEGWGQSIIPQLSIDLKKAFPDMKGFSPRNLGYMKEFAQIWSAEAILQQPVAKLPGPIEQQAVAQLPWGHNIVLMTKLSNNSDRLWYAQQNIQNGWSRNTLVLQIESGLKNRIEGDKKTHNFNLTLPKEQSDLVHSTLKDPYIFDFLSLGKEAHEREIEKGLVDHIQKFLLELGAGFAYVGQQVHLEIAENDYYIDLLFYHTKLHSYVVIELKAGDFKPEYIGKLNFYLSAVDDRIKSSQDNPTIGILLCKTKQKVVAEYALKDISKPMGIAEYKIGDAIPDKIKTSLPTIEELEQELQKQS
jgi:predicted nuclease of restriction endonuclease-like (RecB) superfamily